MKEGRNNNSNASRMQNSRKIISTKEYNNPLTLVQRKRNEIINIYQTITIPPYKRKSNVNFQVVPVIPRFKENLKTQRTSLRDHLNQSNLRINKNFFLDTQAKNNKSRIKKRRTHARNRTYSEINAPQKYH